MTKHLTLQLFWRLSLINLIWLVLSLSNAQSAETPDLSEIKRITENWKCQWCPYPDQDVSSGEVTAGAGYVTNDSFKRGDYTGLDEKGVYLIGGIDYSYQKISNSYVNIKGSELGTDSRDLSVSGGTHGHIVGLSTWYLTGNFDYSELPKLNLDTARTPYYGDAHQQLPAGWTTGATTQAMPQLASALHNEDVYTNRKTFSVTANYQPNTFWLYEFGFQRDSKEGNRTAGLALGNSFALARSAILAIPVDYVTDQGEVTVNYIQRHWHATVSYQFSKFENGEHAIRWENAFSTPATATEGQAALEPDNTMHRITITGAYQISPTTFSNILLAYGRLEQNEKFLPYTINTSITPLALPTDSLDGKVNTLDASVSIASKLTDQIILEARFRQNEQDNDTSRETYDYVIADTLQSSTARSNFPYSFRKRDYLLQGRYLLPKHEISLGINQTNYDRTYQEVDTTSENAIKASYRTSLIRNVDIQVRGERSSRDGDKYQPVTEITPAENPLLRKYNLADRNRDQMGLSASYYPQPQWQLSVYMDAAKDDYSKSELGLLESIQKNYNIALQYQFSEALTFNMDYTLTTIESTQAGSQSFSTPTWHAVNEDQIDVIHVGVTYDVFADKMQLGIDYSYANSEGDIKVSTDGDLPTLTSKRQTFILYGDYKLDENSVVTAFYRYEDYDESDWANDGVNPNSIPNVLSLGEVSPSYNIGVIGLAIKYVF